MERPCEQLQKSIMETSIIKDTNIVEEKIHNNSQATCPSTKVLGLAWYQGVGNASTTHKPSEIGQKKIQIQRWIQPDRNTITKKKHI